MRVYCSIEYLCAICAGLASVFLMTTVDGITPLTVLSSIMTSFILSCMGASRCLVFLKLSMGPNLKLHVIEEEKGVYKQASCLVYLIKL